MSKLEFSIVFFLITVIIWAILFFALFCAFIAFHRWMSGRAAGPAYRGLSRGVLDSLPKLSFAAEHARKFSECPICLTEYSAGEKIRVLPMCCHGFHARCVDAWLVSRASCPSCRRVVVVPADGETVHKELPV